MLAEQCIKDVINRMSIGRMKQVQKHIEDRIRQKSNAWLVDMQQLSRERGYKVDILLPGSYTGLQIRQNRNERTYGNIDINVYSGQIKSESYGLGRYFGYEQELDRSEVIVSNLVEYYEQYYDSHNGRYECRVHDKDEVIMYLKFIVDVWDSYNKQFIEH